MGDFLAFRRFVAPDVLIAIYYLGAVTLPWIVVRYRRKLIGWVPMLRDLAEGLSWEQKRLLWIVGIGCFLCLELLWRMLFEGMIAYFDMHEYLRQIMLHTAS